MTWAPNPPKHDWRAFLTPEEAVIVRAADEAAETAKRLAPERRAIQNRAIQRAKYAKAETAYHKAKGKRR